MMNTKDKINQIVDALQLIPLDGEGGLYRCAYEGSTDADGKKISSAIYYLLDDVMFSHMHQLESDEIYHYYMGDGLELLLLYPDGRAECVVLGTDLAAGERPQVVVPGGVWQGSRVKRGGSYCLVGTTMAPAYRQEEYQHGDCESLCRQYPDVAEKIRARCG